MDNRFSQLPVAYDMTPTLQISFQINLLPVLLFNIFCSLLLSCCLHCFSKNYLFFSFQPNNSLLILQGQIQGSPSLESFLSCFPWLTLYSILYSILSLSQLHNLMQYKQAILISHIYQCQHTFIEMSVLFIVSHVWATYLQLDFKCLPGNFLWHNWFSSLFPLESTHQ